MTLVSVGVLPLWPTSDLISANTVTLDASGEKFAVAFSAPRAGSINKVGFFVTSVTASGTGYDVRIETLSGSTPSGSLVAAGANGSVNISASGWVEATITTPPTVTQGQTLALVVVSPTPGNIAIRSSTQSSLGWNFSSYPFVTSFAGSWTTPSALAACMTLSYVTDGYVEVPGISPYSAATNNSFSDASNPDERGNLLTVPFACRVVGSWHLVSGAGTGAYDVNLYDDTSTLLTATSVAASTTHRAGVAAVVFPSSVDLAAGDVVRVAKRPTSGTAANLNSFTLASSSLRASLPSGTNISGTTRNNSGAWTDSTTVLHGIGLILDEIDNGASAGGGVGAGIRTVGSSVARSVI